MYYCI